MHVRAKAPAAIMFWPKYGSRVLSKAPCQLLRPRLFCGSCDADTPAACSTWVLDCPGLPGFFTTHLDTYFGPQLRCSYFSRSDDGVGSGLPVSPPGRLRYFSNLSASISFSPLHVPLASLSFLRVPASILQRSEP